MTVTASSPRTRMFVQLARVAAVSAALTIIGGIVVSDVLAAETFETPEVEQELDLDHEDDAELETDAWGGPGLLAAGITMPDAKPQPAKPVVAYNLLGEPDVKPEEANAEAPKKKKRKKRKKRRKKKRKFNFGKLDAY